MRYVFIAALLISFVFPASLSAQGREDRRATKAQILLKHGKPVLEDRRQYVESRPDGTVVTVIVEELTYDEPGFHSTFVFHDGRLVQVIRN